MKVDVEYLEYMWPMRHFLVTCGTSEDKSNIIAVSFCMPVSKIPPMLACAVGTKAFSCELIEKTSEFVVNVPTEELEKKVYYCGYNSGRDVDKFEKTGLTPRPARKVRVPIIEECVAHMECIVRQIVDTGDKKLFIGEVIEAYADEAAVKGDREPEYTQGTFPRKVYTTCLRPPTPPLTT